MTATIYINGEIVEKVRLSKVRKDRNTQIKNICKTYEKKNLPCYVDITGGGGHSTVIHSIETAEKLYKTDDRFKSLIDICKI